VTGRDCGRIAEAGGGASYGEAAKLLRDERGRITAVQLAREHTAAQAKAGGEMEARYGRARAAGVALEGHAETARFPARPSPVMNIART
jgi:hypothetical protein